MEQLTEKLTYHTKISLQFAIKIVNYDTSVGDLSLVRIAYDIGDWWASWDLQSSSNIYETIIEADGGQNTVGHPTMSPPLNKWVNVVFTVDTSAETLSLTFDGVSALAGTISAPPQNGSLSVTLGVNYLGGPAQPMSIYYDNIAIVTN
jgi:hypothetical protein